jgi:hypothetical protein
MCDSLMLHSGINQTSVHATRSNSKMLMIRAGIQIYDMANPYDHHNAENAVLAYQGHRWCEIGRSRRRCGLLHDFGERADWDHIWGKEPDWDQIWICNIFMTSRFGDSACGQDAVDGSGLEEGRDDLGPKKWSAR